MHKDQCIEHAKNKAESRLCFKRYINSIERGIYNSIDTTIVINMFKVFWTSLKNLISCKCCHWLNTIELKLELIAIIINNIRNWLPKIIWIKADFCSRFWEGWPNSLMAFWTFFCNPVVIYFFKLISNTSINDLLWMVDLNQKEFSREIIRAKQVKKSKTENITLKINKPESSVKPAFCLNILFREI